MSAAQPEGIVAVLRGHEPGQVERAARVLAERGVRFIEITCTVPDVMGVIERLHGPVDRVGGPAYLHDLAGPYPTLRLMPSGGIDLDDISAYKLPSVASIALGSELAPAAAIASGDWDGIKRRAARALAAWAPST